MATDMKLQIAQAGERLLNEKNRKKLTVTDIVEECHITRQTFYYHFKDIPDMLMWNIQRQYDSLLEALSDKKSIEEIVEYCLLLIVEHKQYAQKVMASNYGEVMVNLVVSTIKNFFWEAIEKNELFPYNTVEEKNLIVAYYACAVGGLVREWDMNGNIDVKAVTKILIQLVSGNIKFSRDKKCIDIR